MFRLLKTYLTSSLALAMAIFLFSGSSLAQGNMQGQGNNSNDSNTKTVVDVVKSKDEVSEFAQLLDKSGYAGVLEKQKGQFTILAPKNEAIDNADPKMKQNPKKLMQGQLFQGNVSKDQVESQMGVKVEKTDKSASNGTVYVVDKLASLPQQKQPQKQQQR